MLFLGFEPEIHPTYFMLIVFASSFRLLVTFAIVLEVHGISFFLYHEPLWQKFLVEPNDHNQSALNEFSILYCDSASSTFLHGLSGRNMLNSFDMLIYASTTQKVICSFELSLFSCFLTFGYQLIVKSMRAFVYRCLLFLWSVEPFYSGMTRRNKLQYLIHIQGWVKAVVFHGSNAIQILICGIQLL